MSDHNEEQPPATVSNDLSLDSLAIHDDSDSKDQSKSYNLYEDERTRALYRWYQDVIATNNTDLNVDDYVGKCKGQENSQQKDTSEEELIDLDEATNIMSHTSEEELIDLDEATNIISHTSEDELTDPDEAVNIIPRREFPLVPSDATVAQAFFVSGLEFTSRDAFATYDNIADLIASLQSDMPSPLLGIFTHNVDTNAFIKSLKGKQASNIASEDDSPEEIVPHIACARCQHNPVNNIFGLTLLTCENCKSVDYCSIDCQNADWTAHQIMYCVDPAVIPPEHLAKPHLPSCLRTSLPNPFARLSKGFWLHDRHKRDVYALLIDCFRLRESDDCWYAGLKNKESIYNGKESSCSLFRLFLDSTEAKGLMPPWWSCKKRVECLDLGLDQSSDNFHDLCAMTRDIEVLVIYESAIMLMQLRMFAESVLGTGPAGTNGQLMLQKMVVVEEAARASAKK